MSEKPDASKMPSEPVTPGMNTDGTNPSRTGLMVLPGVTLFPHSLLPLYIFEDRYRAMLGEALRGDRMFGIAHAGDDGEVAAIGGLGVVRACVANEDGTSNLILQGISRVTFSKLNMEPYPQADISIMPDVGDDEPLGELRKEIDEACLRMRAAGMESPQGFDQYLAQIVSYGAFADAVASAFVIDPTERRGLLEECHVGTRMNRLLRCLLRQFLLETEGTPDL